MNLFKQVLLWLVYFIPALFIELICYVLAPIVAVFAVSWFETDVVKRFDKRILTLWRDNLTKPSAMVSNTRQQCRRVVVWHV